jgi:adenosylhomocysteinase
VKEQAVKVEDLTPELKCYRIPNGRDILVARDGTAVNFMLSTMPVEVLDLVFTEIFLCLMLLLKSRREYEPGVVHRAPENFLNETSKDWLRFVNV